LVQAAARRTDYAFADVRRALAHALADVGFGIDCGDPGHGIDRAHRRVVGRLERAGQIRHPRRGPIAGDLGAARVIVWLDKENAHASSPRPMVRVDEDSQSKLLSFLIQIKFVRPLRIGGCCPRDRGRNDLI
jgi:hypothetical protein